MGPGFLEPNTIEVRSELDSTTDVALRRAEEDDDYLPMLAGFLEAPTRLDPAFPFTEVAETTRSSTLVQFA